MRNYFILFFAALFLASCGGGAGDAGACSTCQTGSTIPVGTVSGTTFDGLIINGTVSVYDFSTGTKGALLGQATTDGLGLYSLSLQVESRPVLIEVGGGYYVEEAGSNANIALSSNHKLSAVANYATGTPLKVAVTTYSHLAAGLAAYQIGQGVAVATAINNANLRTSSLVGVNILTTTPKEITNMTNASATLTPELRYGFLAGAISMWTYNHAPSAPARHLPPYTSIDFAQLLYQDITADGLLDGVGRDSGGNLSPLSFGTTPLGVDAYRLGIGSGIVQIAAHANNRTGLTPTQVLAFAQSYISNTDAFFNAVPVASFAPPVPSFTSPATNAWARRSITVTASATSQFGLQSAEFFVDGVSAGVAPSATSPSFTLNTSLLTDGAHTISLKSVDLAGLSSTTSIQSKVDNTAPTMTGTYTYINASVATVTGTAVDNYSGFSGALGNLQLGKFTTSQNYIGSIIDQTIPVSGVYSVNLVPAFIWTQPGFRVYDAAGNCSDYQFLGSLSLTLATLNVCP